MPAALVLPRVGLIDAHANQVRHDIGEAVIVIAFNPYDFDFTFGVGELTYVSEELPVFFGQPGEVQVRKNVAEQNQPLKTACLQHSRGFARVAGLCTEVQIGKDQRVIDMQIHNLFVARECYGVIKAVSLHSIAKGTTVISEPRPFGTQLAGEGDFPTPSTLTLN